MFAPVSKAMGTVLVHSGFLVHTEANNRVLSSSTASGREHVFDPELFHGSLPLGWLMVIFDHRRIIRVTQSKITPEAPIGCGAQ